VFFEVDFPQGTSVQAAEVAVSAALSRHEALRTTFGVDEAGRPEQTIHPVDKLPPVARVVLNDTEGRAELARELARHEFDLTAEMPVMVTIVSVDNDEVHFAVICCSHVVCDYYSQEIIRTDILALLGDPMPSYTESLGDPGPQPLDIALEEARGGETRAEATAMRYWGKALSAAPSRHFWRSYPPSSQTYRAQAVSYDAPVLMSRYAVAQDSTPTIVYTALVHLLLALISGNTTTLVRFYFTGRPRYLEKSVGPFHRYLFSTMEIPEEEGISACVRATTSSIMAARSRFAIDHLSFREAEIREEARRGSAFAWGSIANVLDTARFRAGWRELASTSPAMHRDDEYFPVTTLGPDVNERGMEVFLTVLADSVRIGVQADYNSMAFRPEDIEILVRGPWDIIRDSLATGGDTTVADLRKRYGLPRPESTAHVAVCAPGVRDTRDVLEQFPGVTASFVTLRLGRSPAEVVAYVAVDRPGVTATDLRDYVMTTLRPAAAVICPGYFIICDTAPADPDKESSWHTVRRLCEGTGSSQRCLVSHTASEAALLQAIGESSDRGPADLAKSYVEGGGALLHVPAILQRLSRLGFAGLHARDFDGHARLYQLARRLSSTGVAEP
jgi:hypothetical protein